MTEASQTNAPSAERLRKVNPFSRHVWQRGQEMYPALRQQLIHDDCDGLDDLSFRISMCLRMTAAFQTGEALDKVRTALVRRYDPTHVHVPYVASLNHLRRFDDALRYAGQLARSEPDSVGAKLLLIDQFFIAGFPGKGIQTIKRSLGDVFQHNRQQAHKLVRILIEAGQLDWLRAHFPQLADRQPRSAQADRLSSGPCDVPVYCISLPADHRRLATTRHFTDYGSPYHVVEGILGRTLPEGIKTSVTRGDRSMITDAEIGCSLSHMKAWEMVARDIGPNDYALIIEDDARFMFGAPRGMTATITAAREAGAELVFINRRACDATIQNLPSRDVELANVDAGFYPDPEQWKPQDPGWGGDGYLVTGAMAARLADMWLKVGVLGAVDWQLSMMCHKRLQQWHDVRALKNIYRMLDGSKDLPMITGYTTNTPLIDTRDHGFSSINAG